MSTASDLRVSHFGICVSDIDKALRFYCDALGFEKAESYEVGGEFGASLEVEGDVQVLSQFVRRPELAIELLYYKSPGTFGKPSANRNQLGITHLSFYVDDLDTVVKRVVDCGGTVIDGTRAKNPGIELLFCADPDGTRVELMKQD